MDEHTRTADEGPDLAVPSRIARFGEYFALPEAAGAGWQGMADLLAPKTLTDLVTATQRAMAQYSGAEPADVPTRAAASSVQLGIAARLMSPVVGAIAALQTVPLLTLSALRWTATGHSVRFAVTELDWRDSADTAVATQYVRQTLLDGVLSPLIEQVHEATTLSTKIMWGNVISAANGAVTVLGCTEPDLVPAGRRLVSTLAQTGPLCGTADTDGATFLRRSCCLYYRVPRGGLCGDCVLAAPTRSQ